MGYSVPLMSSRPPTDTGSLVILSAIDAIAEALYQYPGCCDPKLSTYQAKEINASLSQANKQPDLLTEYHFCLLFSSFVYSDETQIICAT